MPASRVRTSLRGHSTAQQHGTVLVGHRHTPRISQGPYAALLCRLIPGPAHMQRPGHRLHPSHLQRSPSAAMRASASCRRLPFSTPLVTRGMGMSRWMRYTRTQGGTSDRMLHRHSQSKHSTAQHIDNTGKQRQCAARIQQRSRGDGLVFTRAAFTTVGSFMQGHKQSAAVIDPCHPAVCDPAVCDPAV